MAEAGQDKTLRDVAIGETATVRRLVGEGALKRHIMDMASPRRRGVRSQGGAARRPYRGHRSRL